MTRVNVRLFNEKCEFKLTELRRKERKNQLTFNYPLKAPRCLQIRTPLVDQVHYEWWIDRNNNIRVALHLEKQADPDLNRERYEQCRPLVVTITSNLIKGGYIDHGTFGEARNWHHITISKKLTSDEVKDCEVDWAVDMMQLMLNTFDAAVQEL